MERVSCALYSAADEQLAAVVVNALAPQMRAALSPSPLATVSNTGVAWFLETRILGRPKKEARRSSLRPVVECI